MKPGLEDRLFTGIVYVFLALLAFVTLYPFWNSAVISFNIGADTALGGLTFWPRKFTLDNYKLVFGDQRLLDGFLISVLRTVSGTVLAMFFTSLFAFGISRKQLIGRRVYIWISVITMYFSGGLIPTFLVIRSMHMMDTFWVMIMPTIINVWNMIVFRSFFQELPEALEESAKMDGAGWWRIYFSVIIPLSIPVLATLSLFTAVSHWNDWFTASIYITSQKLMPLQTILQQLLNSNIMSEQMSQSNGAAQSMMDNAQSVTTKSLIMATMMVATLPILIVYPFLQKYFVKGVLIGSIKG